MSCSLYGKLPARRDFIALAVPQTVLNAWEPWLQGAISASRHGLGASWTEAYLRAPIWRFWLGAGIAGEVLLGAIMPSADGIGRYFPLTLFCRASHPEGLPPPEVEPFEGWFRSAESFLLSTLSQHTAFEAVKAGLVALPDAIPSRSPATAAGTRHLRGGAMVAPVEDGDVAAAMGRLGPHSFSGPHASMSYWWTAGGLDFPALAFACAGLPDPHLFSGFLTGRFDAHAT